MSLWEELLSDGEPADLADANGAAMLEGLARPHKKTKLEGAPAGLGAAAKKSYLDTDLSATSWVARLQVAFEKVLRERGAQVSRFRVQTACSGTGPWLDSVLQTLQTASSLDPFGRVLPF